VLALLAALALLSGALPAAAAPAALPGAAAIAPTYIVALTDDAGPGDLRDLIGGLPVLHTYRHALHGFAAPLLPEVARRLAADPRVAYVEQDREVRRFAVPTGVARIDADRAPAAGIGTGTAADVDIAILDTGVDAGHRTLDVVARVNCQSGLLGGGSCTTGGNDDNGHGTHVAGTAAARDDGLDVVGVAPGARIWSVKVLGGPLGTGSISDIVKGVDWVTARADQIEVINMSLGGGGTSQAMNDAVRRATEAGVVVVVAAGNDGRDAGGTTPANAPNAITVSAITDLDGKPGGLAAGTCSGRDDTFATYSNFGAVVDIAAPGSCITSTRNGGGTTSLSGTSMAAPHVAGAAALFIADRGVPRTADRWRTVRAGLLGEWSTPADSACGFSGARSAEPLLLLVPCGTDPDPAPTDPEPTDPEPTDPEPTDPEPVADLAVGGITYASGSLLLGGRYLDVTVEAVDDEGRALRGAAVAIELRLDGAVYSTRTGTTGTNGRVTFQHDRVPRGCWTTVVTSLSSGERVWDGVTPENGRCT
jgi:subtilisin